MEEKMLILFNWNKGLLADPGHITIIDFLVSV